MKLRSDEGRRHFRVTLLLALLLVSGFGPYGREKAMEGNVGLAAEETRTVGEKTLVIKAPRCEYDVKSREGVFRGRGDAPARATYGEWQLAGMTLTYQQAAEYLQVQGGVTLAQEGEQPLTASGETLQAWLREEKVVFQGEVRFHSPDYQARAEKATYWGKEGKLLLEGNPVVWHQGNTMRGKVITVLLRPQVRILVEDATVEMER